MKRKSLAFVLVALLGLRASEAHDPDGSWAIVQVVDGTLRVDVEMAFEAAQALLGVPMGTAPAPEDPTVLIAPLTAAAEKVYSFKVGETVLKLKNAEVELREEDGVAFHLVFVLPPGARGPLHFEAKYLEHVTPFHRAAISLVDAHGGVMAGKVLDVDKRSDVLPLRSE